jgi:hypothetical protein
MLNLDVDHVANDRVDGLSQSPDAYPAAINTTVRARNTFLLDREM